MSFAVIRTRSSDRVTDPSMMASTSSVLAISVIGRCVFLKRITEVREMTRTSLNVERRAVTASVMPSGKYSCCGSFEKFARGRTAMDRIGVTAVVDREVVVNGIHRTAARTIAPRTAVVIPKCSTPKRKIAMFPRRAVGRARSRPGARHRAQPHTRTATTRCCDFVPHSQRL